jgi:hypothetical protein
VPLDVEVHQPRVFAVKVKDLDKRGNAAVIAKSAGPHMALEDGGAHQS